MKTPKQKHMSFSDRLHIQELLNQKQSFSKIAKVSAQKTKNVNLKLYFRDKFLCR